MLQILSTFVYDDIDFFSTDPHISFNSSKIFIHQDLNVFHNNCFPLLNHITDLLSA